jgi:hypothetical protein
MINDAAWVMRSRRNFYTAVTRARKGVAVYATNRSLQYALWNTKEHFIKNKTGGTMFVVLFNGPPRSGKDTAANIAKETLDDVAFNKEAPVLTGYTGAAHFKFATPLKDAVHRFFSMPSDVYNHSEYDGVKDDKTPLLFYKSLRECYISLSEEWAKPVFGKDVFWKALA